MKYSSLCAVAGGAIAWGSLCGPEIQGADPERQYEDVSSAKFDHPTDIDNEWFPLVPGIQRVWDGTVVDEEGDIETHSIVFTVTDLTKEIGGVKTVVCLDRDIADRELEEAEIIFFAQDNDGNVWQFGEYPEEYEDDKLAAAPCWMHGVAGARAGLAMLADPKMGSPTYSQGWAPVVDFTDRAYVYKTGENVTVAFRDYNDVLVINESNDEEPDAHQLKYFARGVGNIRIGWRGNVTDQEELDLIRIEKLSEAGLAKARERALQLEKRAYEISKDVYAHTKPCERRSPEEPNAKVSGQ